MSLKKAAVSGIQWTTISVIGRVVFQLAQISILTRYLPKQDFGLVAMALFIIQFSNIFVDMGITTAILHKQDITKREYSSLYWLTISVSLMLYMGLFFCAPFFAHFYKEVELEHVVPILGLNLLFVTIGRQHNTIMKKQMQFKAIAVIELISIPIGLVVSVVLAVKGFGVYSLIYSTLIVSLISNGLFLIRNLRLNPILLHFRLSETRPFLKIGGFTMGSTFLDFFSREIDVLIIGKMLGAESLGVYSLSKQMVIRLYAVINPVVLNVLTPLLSLLQNEKEKIKTSYLKVVKYLAYINFPIYALLVVCSKEVLHLFYGRSYSDSQEVLAYLAIAYCLVTISNPVGSLQVATGRTDLGFKWTIFRVIIAPIVIFLGAMKSVETVAFSNALLSLVLIVPLWFVQLKPMIAVKLGEYLQQFYRPFVAIIFSVALVYALTGYIDLFVNIWIVGVIKAVLVLSLFICFSRIFDKKNLEDFLQMVFSVLKRII